MTARNFPLIVTLAIAIALLAYGPIAQLANYHNFADQSVWLGVAHAGDVLSNAGFALVGLAGIVLLWPQRDQPHLRAGWPGYQLFLISLVLTAAGSAWYHLAPDNGRLIFDRLPIALACAGLLAAVHGESTRSSRTSFNTLLLALAAIASVGWWALTENYRSLAGVGDLRPYLLLQILPLVLIPLWQYVYRVARADRIAFGLAIGLYVLAKATELSDHQIATLSGGLTGHTIKHLLATAAAGVLVFRLVARGHHQLSTSSASASRIRSA